MGCSPSHPAVVKGKGLPESRGVVGTHRGLLETCVVLNSARPGLVPAGEGKGEILAGM